MTRGELATRGQCELGNSLTKMLRQLGLIVVLLLLPGSVSPCAAGVRWVRVGVAGMA